MPACSQVESLMQSARSLSVTESEVHEEVEGALILLGARKHDGDGFGQFWTVCVRHRERFSQECRGTTRVC